MYTKHHVPMGIYHHQFLEVQGKYPIVVVIVIEYSYDVYHSADKSSVGKKRAGFFPENNSMAVVAL